MSRYRVSDAQWAEMARWEREGIVLSKEEVNKFISEWERTDDEFGTVRPDRAPEGSALELPDRWGVMTSEEREAWVGAWNRGYRRLTSSDIAPPIIVADVLSAEDRRVYELAYERAAAARREARVEEVASMAYQARVEAAQGPRPVLPGKLDLEEAEPIRTPSVKGREVEL